MKSDATSEAIYTRQVRINYGESAMQEESFKVHLHLCDWKLVHLDSETSLEAQAGPPTGLVFSPVGCVPLTENGLYGLWQG